MNLSQLLAFYRSPAIRERIAEYSGGRFDDKDSFSTYYFIGFGEALLFEGYTRPILCTSNQEIHEILERGLDIFRSIRDKKANIAVYDIEYYNLESMYSLYAEQERLFSLIEPVFRIIKSNFERFGIDVIINNTTSGYHFVSRIPFTSEIWKTLSKMVEIEEPLKGKYSLSVKNDLKRLEPTSLGEAVVYEMIGRLLEFLSFQIILEAMKLDTLPVTISDVATGRKGFERDGISLDITQYGDPLYMRPIRTVFSAHQKHLVEKWRVRDEKFPFWVVIPRGTLGFEEAISIRKDLKRAEEYARNISTTIPDSSKGWGNLLKAYIESRHYRFHREFYKVRPDPREVWYKTYLAFNPKSIPPCAGISLMEPNPRLLNPTHLQTLCRILLANDWHPRHIAGLIRAYYEGNHGWGIDWFKYDPAMRADFWARIFCGMILLGVDTLEDLTCPAYRKKGACPEPACGYNLESFSSRLRSKRI